MSLPCFAAEIVAWKVPLSSYTYRDKESPGVVRLKSAPEASPFFKEGDELWDLKEIAIVNGSKIDPPLEWAVWNASTERLVTKADWRSIWHLHQELRIDQMPKQCRITTDFFEVPADIAGPSGKSIPVSSLTFVSRSGRDFKTSRKVDSSEITMDGNVTAGESVVDLQLAASCTVRDLPRLDFNCGLTLKSRVPVWVARDFDGTTGLDCRVSGRVELIDGTPPDECVLIQKGTAAEPLVPEHTELTRQRIGEKGCLLIQGMDPSILSELSASGSEPAKEFDPFTMPPEAIQDTLKLKEVMAPENLRAWLPRPVWDTREIIKKAGIAMNDADFAGYDPLMQKMFFYTDDETRMDMFEALLMPGCILQTKHVVVSVEGIGQSRLVTRSGLKSSLTRSLSGKDSRSMEIEPTIGEENDLVDLRLVYLDEPDPKHKQAITTALTLHAGKFAEIMGGSGNGAVTKPLRVKAEILENLR